MISVLINKEGRRLGSGDQKEKEKDVKDVVLHISPSAEADPVHSILQLLKIGAHSVKLPHSFILVVSCASSCLRECSNMAIWTACHGYSFYVYFCAKALTIISAIFLLFKIYLCL